jgi:epoxyqueuosine reductase
MLAMNYGPDRPAQTLPARSRDDLGLCAQPRLSRRHQGQAEGAGGQNRGACGGDVKVFVDTAPVMEKPLAAAAGLGWQGKHTNLVSREFGSWLFLGSIFTTAELPPTRRRSTIAAPAGPASTPARPTPFRRPTSSMRGAASPT